MGNLVFEYYKEIARVLGEKTGDGNVTHLQAAYSLFWFFCENDVEHLNPLTKSFLGERDWQNKLEFSGKVPENLEQYFIEDANPNQSQREAIIKALTNQISFIEGPPGTGKTATILNLVSCITALHKTVAVVSGNNSAIQNVEEKVEGYCLDKPNQKRMKESLAKLGNTDRRKTFNSESRYEKAFKTKKVQCGDVEISREKSIKAENFTKKYPFITSTIHSLKKCFADGATYQYDYVIVDESSQVDLIAGIVAMSAAKHLILIGDDNQLPPVIDIGKVGKAQVDDSAIDPRYCLEENKSFLTVCMDIYKEYDVKALLKEHYRCHPGIIGFCHQKVYDNSLVIKTKNFNEGNKVPIRVWWFEGNYCEKCNCSNGLRTSKRNRKQIKIFIEKEWPKLVEKLSGINPPSVCILTPFRGQLEELDRVITEYNEKNKIEIKIEFQGKEMTERHLEDDTENSAIPMITVHKSQGREFDIVYFLPVEDGDWEYPWSQHKRLVNVAVSRAKRELCVITSVQLMSKELQCALSKKGYIPPSVRKNKNTDVDEEEQRFVQKLLDYVHDTSEDNFPESNTEYGFHDAGTHSIFDEKSRILQERVKNKKNDGETENKTIEKQYSTEILVKNALLDMPEFKDNSLKLYQNILIRDLSRCDKAKVNIKQMSKEEEGFYKNGAQIDFLICAKGKVIAAIEVDGAWHRFGENKEEYEKRKCRDEMKDHILEKCFKEMPFIRLPDDGSTADEQKLLRDLIDKGRTLAPIYRYYALSISKVVENYNKSKKNQGTGIDVKQLQMLLEEKGLLFKDSENEKNAVIWRPTDGGKLKGISRGYGFYKKEDEKFEGYEAPYYTRCAVRKIISMIEGELKMKQP